MQSQITSNALAIIERADSTLERDRRIELLANRFAKTEEWIRSMIEPQWFPAEVLWNNISSSTLSTAFPGDVTERRFVFFHNRFAKPLVKWNRLEFQQVEAPTRPRQGERIVFRFTEKNNEHLSKCSLGPRGLYILSSDIQWSWQYLYAEAKRNADTCPEYRLITRQKHKIGEVPNRLKRCWEPVYKTEEIQRWRGCDLERLKDFLDHHHFTKYDGPVYQQRVNEQWKDCSNPLESTTF